jgi:hypothetical protein
VSLRTKVGTNVTIQRAMRRCKHGKKEGRNQKDSGPNLLNTPQPGYDS